MAIESSVLDEWYPVAVIEDVEPGVTYPTRLLGTPVNYALDDMGAVRATRTDTGSPCQVRQRLHTVWLSLGEPPADTFALPEFDEPGRRILGAGSFAVHASGLRVIENFLDMAHFPYVHTGLLGEEPHTEVAPYRVEHESGELFARDCRFYQPMSAASAQTGIDAHYVYRVARPFTAMLYKTSPQQPARRDVICLFVQPVDESRCIAHTVLVYLDDSTSDSGLRLFQQTIFGQDLMILSNHVPRTLPLDLAFEMPTRADAMSVAYRRWLRERGVAYGTFSATGALGISSSAGH
ncbi:aromatic ring-hydroxylating dioxygenase subunit alpha [Paraburkholderia sp. A2WS-5]|uniref:aromatic ring-hydroxylating dioxygenase subunit alpha n=1 Tax=unclassified Paraburkholderia TaxID=2615204 RepID=UPI003B7FB3F4